MKLGELKASIRSTKGSPVIEIKLTPDAPMTTLALMKGPLMEALDAAFPGGKATPTGLTFEKRGDDNLLRPEAGGIYGLTTVAPAPPLEIMQPPTPATSLLLDLDAAPAPAASKTTLLV